MNDTVCVLTHSLYDRQGRELQIGGVQTYVMELCNLLSVWRSCRISVLQPSDVSFEREYGSKTIVYGIAGRLKNLRNHYWERYRGKTILTVLANFSFAVWAGGEPTIAIQHGIAHDGFYSRHSGLSLTAHRCYAAWMNMRTAKQTKRVLNSVNKIVCVDLNFPNWVRAHFPLQRWEDKLVYVPNFGVPKPEQWISQKLSSDDRSPGVLIARRFEPHRGFPMIAKIVSEIAPEYPSHRFIFAGTGILSESLHRYVQHHSNCEVMKLSHTALSDLYRECSVSIIPTLWSEGTSLSCIESMCNGLTVVATNVGGLGNIILGGLNGELVSPVEQEIKAGIRRVLNDGDYARRLAYNGWLTAKSCFSLDAWRDRMMRVLNSLAEDDLMGTCAQTPIADVPAARDCGRGQGESSKPMAAHNDLLR